MPLFYFDIVERTRILSDEQGQFLVDSETAIRQAAMIARERASYNQYEPCFVEVKDTAGSVIAKILVAKKSAV